MQLLKSIYYSGHLLKNYNFSLGEDYLNKDIKGQYDLVYTIEKAAQGNDGRFVLDVGAKVTAKSSEDNLDIFSLFIEYQSIFHVESEIDGDTYTDHEWYFKKFIQRSGKQIIDDLLRHTAFRSLLMPSYISEETQK